MAVSMTMRVGTKPGSRRRRRQTSRPDMSGRPTSSRTRSGFSAWARASAAAPSAASTTRTCSSSSVRRTSSTMLGSSSTISTVGTALVDCERRAGRVGSRWRGVTRDPDASLLAMACTLPFPQCSIRGGPANRGGPRGAAAAGTGALHDCERYGPTRRPWPARAGASTAAGTRSMRGLQGRCGRRRATQILERLLVPGGDDQAPAGDDQARQRTRQGSERARVVNCLRRLVLRAACQSGLGALFGPPGSGAVDLVRSLAGVSQDDHLVVAHLGEAAGDRQVVLVAPLAISQLADAERGEERRMAWQHAEVALDPRGDDLVDLLGDDEPRRRRDLEGEGVGHLGGLAQALGLVHRVADVADHVEGLLGQLVVLALHD